MRTRVEDKQAFTQAVYDIVKTIPRGRATSYGAIARAVGYPNMSRFVGRVMCECDADASNIPAHRVVNSQGVLSAGNVFSLQRELLKEEGVAVSNNRICKWKTIFWDPMEEITL
ncbi:MGMT family protein [Dysgonomonas sp. 25]|uniref:MGMT family protein n=1 Tax=Dysgonomonas sp. 25 TaxID=2302933 RepID=UPI0013D4F996|nr:MGMT family protein [Dysgonomonas sp. 25]NDV69710.1 cysteine methyltransferase [Dysgonomonas sp. 25]